VARSLAGVGRRVGTALLGAALPALVATLGAALVAGEAADGPVAWLDAALATSVTGGEGLQWAFHVAVVVGVVGLTALAAALVVEGYFDLE
jgi:hypothetical protein